MHYVSDSDLIARVLGGEVDAYGPLVRRYQDAYFRFALRMLGSRDDADDALQSAFVRAYRKLAECRDPSRFGAWLYQIVINECRTLAVRRDRRERKLVRDDTQMDRLVEVEVFDNRLGVEEIQRALNELPVEQREAFVLKYVEELGYGEMSDLTGAGVSALKMRVKRACQSLRELLGQSRSLS